MFPLILLLIPRFIAIVRNVFRIINHWWSLPIYHSRLCWKFLNHQQGSYSSCPGLDIVAGLQYVRHRSFKFINNFSTYIHPTTVLALKSDNGGWCWIRNLERGYRVKCFKNKHFIYILSGKNSGFRVIILPLPKVLVRVLYLFKFQGSGNFTSQGCASGVLGPGVNQYSWLSRGIRNSCREYEVFPEVEVPGVETVAFALVRLRPLAEVGWKLTPPGQ